MSKTVDRHSDNGGPAVATFVIIAIAVGLIFLPMACGLVVHVDLSAALVKSP